jgi:predicted flap endonuclease-1-like 5' DNA nuclease
MDLDGNILLIVGAALVALLLLVLLLARRSKQRVRLGEAAPSMRRPVAAPRAAAPTAAEGDGVADEAAAAARDVAGELLGVDAHEDPGAGAGRDNLQTLKGVGPKLAAQLSANGITRFDQLARLGANEVAILDAKMGAFRGRIARDRLVEQAAYLSRGDVDGFESQFGKLGGSA